MKTFRSVVSVLAAASLFAWAQGAFAASSDDDDSEKSGDEADAEHDAATQGDEEKGEDEGDAKKEKAKKGDDDSEASESGDEKKGSPIEVPGKSYQFVGLRYRMLVIPKFMMNLFGDGGTTVVAHQFGPEFLIRKDDFEYELSATYVGYNMDPTPFKSSSDAEDAWELVESRMKALYFTVDFMWSKPIVPEFAITFGGGAGFGIVFGDLLRTQAYRERPGGDLKACNGPGNPAFVAAPGLLYCGNDNDHYSGYTEPSWFSGGSKPVMFPWLAAQFGFRFKPHKNFAGRLDMGIGVGHFFVGLGADYGL